MQHTVNGVTQQVSSHNRQAEMHQQQQHIEMQQQQQPQQAPPAQQETTAGLAIHQLAPRREQQQHQQQQQQVRRTEEQKGSQGTTGQMDGANQQQQQQQQQQCEAGASQMQIEEVMEMLDQLLLLPLTLPSDPGVAMGHLEVLRELGGPVPPPGAAVPTQQWYTSALDQVRTTLLQLRAAARRSRGVVTSGTGSKSVSLAGGRDRRAGGAASAAAAAAVGSSAGALASPGVAAAEVSQQLQSSDVRAVEYGPPQADGQGQVAQQQQQQEQRYGNARVQRPSSRGSVEGEGGGCVGPGVRGIDGAATATSVPPAAAAARIEVVGKLLPPPQQSHSEAGEVSGVDATSQQQQQGAVAAQWEARHQHMDAVSSIEPAGGNSGAHHGRVDQITLQGPSAAVPISGAAGFMGAAGEGIPQETSSHAAGGRPGVVVAPKIGRPGQLPELLPDIMEAQLENAFPWLLMLLDVVEGSRGEKLQLLKRVRGALKWAAGQEQQQLAKDRAALLAGYRELQQAVAGKDVDAVKRVLQMLVG